MIVRKLKTAKLSWPRWRNRLEHLLHIRKSLKDLSRKKNGRDSSTAKRSATDVSVRGPQRLPF